MITVIGFPTDKNSSYLQGAALAPNAIMKEFYSESRNKFSENGVNLGLDNLWKYNGCLDLDILDNDSSLIKDRFWKTFLLLSNNDLMLCDCIFTIPVSDSNHSFNLSHSVLLVAYKWQEYFNQFSHIFMHCNACRADSF